MLGGATGQTLFQIQARLKKILFSPNTFVFELRRDIKLVNSNITESDLVSDIERTWVRNEKCMVIFGKSFQFFKKWEGDLTEAEILSGTFSKSIRAGF